jgi:hypothetical protein
MVGAITQYIAYSTIDKEYSKNIRMIMTSSIMYLEPNTDDITKFKDKYYGKYLSLGLSFELKEHDITLTDVHLFNGFNTEYDKYKIKLKNTKKNNEDINILNTIVIKGFIEGNMYDGAINITELIPLSELIKSDEFDFDVVLKKKVGFATHLHMYGTYLRRIIRSLIK